MGITHVPQWMQNMSINVNELAAGLLGLCAAVEVSRKKQAL